MTWGRMLQKRCLLAMAIIAVPSWDSHAALVALVPTFHRARWTTKRPSSCRRRLDSSCWSDDINDNTSGPSAIRSQSPSPTNATALQMVSFYRFFDTATCKETLRDTVFDAFREMVPGIRGTLYIANEGINGQFAVPVNVVDAFVTVCTQHHLVEQTIDDLNWGGVLPIETPTFQKLVVRTRDVILRDGLSNHDSLNWNHAGEELTPAEWDHQLRRQSSQSLRLIDCRNEYETRQGTFQDAIPLNTTTFSESWPVLQQQFATGQHNKEEPVYIYCTGGIRCVKVGAYMTQTLGFTNVKRLKHGIIGYQKWHHQQQETKEQPDVSSLWQGDNFLFDKRRFGGRIN
ncbi:UPF0176 protein YceA [Seminavis robusta]|uniref:UPF0176 protein YceA n=1 Tax=Seminavis robusta TaxID=568900 RepID=A0A9N8HUL8_9STRA|nr:UPF0176 protein YceA [Seminavis robusta]|eukprot:Sro1841_g300940.1 UPF0176 protein YceA (344) ;mRNA; f:620-1651